MNQSKFLAMTCNLLKTSEKNRVYKGRFVLLFNGWETGGMFYKPITKRSSRNFQQSFENCSISLAQFFFSILLYTWIPALE